MPRMKPTPALSPEQIEEFWSRVDQSGGPDACWPWREGYGPEAHNDHRGRFIHIVGSKRHYFLANRIAYALEYGDPGPLEVCHHCDNDACCNPAHLFLGTHADNMRDMKNKKRSPRKERKLNEDAVRQIRASTLSNRALARKYGVDPSNISAIRNHRSWKHVT